MSSILYGGYANSTFHDVFGGADQYTVCEAALASRFKFDGLITECVTPGLAGVLPTTAVRAWHDTNAGPTDAQLDAAVYRGGSAAGAGQLGDFTTENVGKLLTPIAVLVGDAGGLCYTGAKLKYDTGTGRLGCYQHGDKTTTPAWDASANNLAWQLQFYGIPMEVVTFGDSISHGACDTGTDWRPLQHADYWVQGHRNAGCNLAGLIRAAVGLRSSVNVGLGGQTAAWGVTAWGLNVTPYVARNALVVVNFGINDIVAGVADEAAALAAHQACWDTFKIYAANDKVKLIRQSILHLGTDYSGYAALNATVDTWNAAMAAWCSTNGILNVDVDVSGGTTLAEDGKLSTGGIHPIAVGYAAIAANLAAAIGTPVVGADGATAILETNKAAILASGAASDAIYAAMGVRGNAPAGGVGAGSGKMGISI